jgi:hypothetical protein
MNVGRFDFMAIIHQEDGSRGDSDTFVTVDESMVFDKPE